jgi:hypothetical protein
MAMVVRAACGAKWGYVPVGGPRCETLRRLADSGLASSGPVEVRLHHDAGPLFWKERETESGGDPPLSVLEAMSDRGLGLEPGEEVVFGRADGAYNEFADITLAGSGRSTGRGLALSAKGLSDGAVVLTAWPGERKILPALVKADGPKYSLELAEPGPAGARCFVLDETGRNLITASMESDGSDDLRVMAPMALDSWLFAIGSMASREASERFFVKVEGKSFSIYDNKKGRRYAGSLKHDPSDQDKWGMEQERLHWLLASRGLGGILPIYELEKT